MLHPITIIIIRHLVLLALLLPQTAKISYSIGAGKKKTDNALHPDTFAVPVYSIFNINAVNSAGLDFSPVLYESKLVFISERELDYINYGESRFKKSSYLSVQYSNILNKDNTLNYTKPKGFSDQINQLNHNGPISFSKDGKYAVFTRTNYYKNNKDNIFRPRLYSAEKEDEKWKNIKLMAINKGDFSYAHPYLSPDGLQLFFTSDRDGGYGGKDLYMCEKRDTGWSAPLNLGHEINTEGDEVFPTISADKTLYFSSNGHGGLGGLDIFYSSKENGTWNPPVNIDSSINSVQDDFGLVFNEDKKSGYFSSNRAGGQGKDDIYGFTVKLTSVVEKKISIAGRFRYNTLPPKSADEIKIFIIDETGRIIQTALTDIDGYFAFKNLPYGVNYRLKTEGEKNGIELEMLNKNNSFITFAPDSSGVFLYRKLSFKNFGELSFLYTVNYDVLNEDENLTKSFKGQLTGDQVSGRTVILFNEEGKAFAKATADNKGNFTFKDLPYLGNYHIALETTEPNTGMLVYINNNVVAKMAVNDKGEFVYIELNHKMLSGLNMLDTKSGNLILDDDFPGYESKWVTEINSTGSITGKFLYKSLPEKLSGEIKIILINEFGETIETAISDKEGYFSFNKLPYNRNYILKTEEYIPGLSLQLFDMNNNVKFTLVNDNSGKFLYKELSYKDLKSIDFLFVRDDTLNTVDATKSLTGRVIYKESPYNESANLHIYLINDEGEVIYSTVADKNGNFIFTNLPFASNYIIKTEKYNPDMDIVIFNHEKQVAQLAVNEKGEYVYLKLPQRATGDLALMEIDANYMITRGAEKMSPEEKYNEKIIFSDKTKTAFVFNTIQPKLNNDLSMIHGKPLGLCPESEGLAMEDLNDCIDLTIDELLSNEYSPVDNTKDHIGPENKTETGKGITFTLYFQFNSVELTPASKLDIEKVISALSNNPLYKLNINAHTDSQGEEEYNNLLSRKRAEVLKKAIAGQSIDGNQIISKEFGESQPAIVCTGKCSIAQHKLNRRAELIINY